MTDHYAILTLFCALSFPGIVAGNDADLSAESATQDVDPSTLIGKVMCGYQGWFNCDQDGANLGWSHWARRWHEPFAPGNVTVDLWPDVSEFGPDERYPTGFRHADGRVAEVFSSASRKTVLRHFDWMRDYGIDGAFIQRFANGLADPRLRSHKNVVLSHARQGARRAGRVFAVMYDLSGLREGQVARVREDWQWLREAMEVTEDRGYLHHEGKPVVAVWGIGFSDDRRYSLNECRKLVEWLKETQCTVMLGVPSWWREGNRDAVGDPLLHEILKQADIISPWTVGRYRTPKQAAIHAKQVWEADLVWCRKHRLDLMPVVFPGFSWHNLHGGKLDQIPRLQGRFLWSQLVAAKQIGCKMVYVAMFDEVDEGTAIFKCTNDPPVGDGVSLLSYDGVPTDHYLRLVGQGARMLRGELPWSEKMPKSTPTAGGR